MAAIINLSIKASELKGMDQSKVIIGKKDNYIPITVKINNESSQFGKNAKIMIRQTEEERKRGDLPHYLGEGNVVWTDGQISKGSKPDQNSGFNPQPGDNHPFPQTAAKNDQDLDDLPF
jgi:hypothetical protein